MMLFSVTLAALAIAYATVLVRLSNGFRATAARWKPQMPDTLPRVSVVVPARNEARDVAQCIQSILRNDYPDDLFDVTVVDDASEDRTAEIVSGLVAGAPRLKLIRLVEFDSPRHGKRAAIETAIAHSEGDIILLTDADSEVPPAWIRIMLSAFGPETRFVSGPVAYRPGRSPLDRLLELELLGLVSLGAGAIAAGRPQMCNGANIAFRRSAFEEVHGYEGTEDLTSGDDELFMQKVARSYPGSVAFCPDRGALVTTRAPRGIRALFRQRRRWASKGLHYQDRRITLLALLVYAFNIMLVGGALMSLQSISVWPALLIALVIKLLAEGWMFWNVCGHFDRRHLLPGMFAGQLFEIPYVVAVGAAGAAGRYTWKGREIRR